MAEITNDDAMVYSGEILAGSNDPSSLLMQCRVPYRYMKLKLVGSSIACKIICSMVLIQPLICIWALSKLYRISMTYREVFI